jgi:nucleotide-binding universal stress UspA family protein
MGRRHDEASARQETAEAFIKRRVIAGTAPPVLIAEAADPATMLVVGSGGCDGFAGLLLGSVSQQSLHHARGPVDAHQQRAQQPTGTPNLRQLAPPRGSGGSQ